MSAPTHRRYPLDHFLALTGWTFTDVRYVAPCNGTEYRLRRDVGVTERAADVIATRAGFHPHEVWPEMLTDAIAELGLVCDECGESFQPSHKARGDVRFCSRRCNKRFYYRKSYAGPFGEKERERKRREYRESAEYFKASARRRYHRKRTEGAA